MTADKPESQHRSEISLKKNIAANFTGSIWQALMGLVFVPLYIKFMGIESYGLIGIFTTLQTVFALLDVGLGSTLARELARLSVLPHKKQEMRDLVRTLETLYWGIATLAGFLLVFLSPFIAKYWIQTEQLSPGIVKQALIIMGFIMVFQMPIGFYSGGLMGLQKQLLLNIINVCMSTLRGLGAVLILWLISPTIQAFLLWQIVISVTNVFLSGIFLWRSLPYNTKHAAFQKQILKDIWKFTAGISMISILGVILSQVDKIILSKLLSLDVFGYYVLAGTVAGSLSRLYSPIVASIYPKFVQLVSLNDEDGLKRLYHKSCQFISVIILPVSTVVALFSYEILLLWTQNPITAERTHLLVTISICGTALNGLMHTPSILQLAFGWTKLILLKDLISVILVVPLIIYLTIQYGAIGAASVWLILNVADVLFEIPIMHYRLLRTEMWRWYWRDIILPLISALSIVGFGKLFFYGTMSQSMISLYLVVLALLAFGTTLSTAPTIRSILYVQFLKMRPNKQSQDHSS